MVLKNIKVTENTKSELDSIAYDKETYNVTIGRLIRENQELKTINDDLKKDKDLLTKMVMKTDNSITLQNMTHSTIWVILNIIGQKESTIDEKVKAIKTYLKPNLKMDSSLVKKAISDLETEYEINSPVLTEIKFWVDRNY